jgi:DNA-directed RNA polymerase subunit RPC12/RpoP
MPYREETNRDWWRVGGFFLLLVVIIFGTARILIPVSWPVGFVVWLVIFVSSSLFLLVRWHTNNTAYHCPACSHQFVISMFTNFTSPHFPNKKYLKCPQCDVRNWATVLMKKG